MSQQWGIFHYNVFNTGTLSIYWVICPIVDSISYIRKYNLQTRKMVFTEICGMLASS